MSVNRARMMVDALFTRERLFWEATKQHINTSLGVQIECFPAEDPATPEGFPKNVINALSKPEKEAMRVLVINCDAFRRELLNLHVVINNNIRVFPDFGECIDPSVLVEAYHIYCDGRQDLL